MAHVLEDGKRNEYLNNAKTYLEQCYEMRSFGELSEISFDPEASNGVFNVNNKTTCPEILFRLCISKEIRIITQALPKILSRGRNNQLSLCHTRGTYAESDT